MTHALMYTEHLNVVACHSELIRTTLYNVSMHHVLKLFECFVSKILILVVPSQYNLFHVLMGKNVMNKK